MHLLPSWFLRLSAILLAVACIPAAELTVVPDRADGVYRPGDQVTWTIAAKAGEAAPTGLAYTVKSGGTVEVAKGTVAFSDGKATVSASSAQPGTLLLAIPHDGKQSFGGAAFAWERIEPSAPEPSDFDAFWTSKLAELAAVPADPRLEAVDSGVPGVDLWKISMGNIRGSRIHGYLARPAKEGPCPAMLQVQYAGVYPLNKEWSVGPAKNGWMVLNILAHDLPVDQPKEFYAEQNDGPLKNYPIQGNDDRDTSYFLRMYLSCHRAADYLATRPDWNRTTLLVQGGSQGGLQAVVTAALHPAVTTLTANVPAGCDHTGALARREPGWPRWVNASGEKRTRQIAASGYYDVVNFARRVRCPALIGLGLVDTTCPPAGVFAMFNQIAAPKRLILMPTADHMGPHQPYYGAIWAWWNAAKDGKALPLK
jgi:cephalosporin-C deacetylase-like acetyl esterase